MKLILIEIYTDMCVCICV